MGRTYRANSEFNVKKARKKSKQKRDVRKHKKEAGSDEQ